MDAKKAELEIQNQVMKINRQVANIIYTEKVFSSIMKDYDNGDHALSVAEIVLHIIARIKRMNGEKMPPHIVFAMGIMILQRLQADIEATGRPALTKEESVKAINFVIEKYLELYKYEIDVKDVGAQLKQLQKNLADGTFSKKVAPMLKTEPKIIDNVINNKPAIQPGMLKGAA